MGDINYRQEYVVQNQLKRDGILISNYSVFIFIEKGQTSMSNSADNYNNILYVSNFHRSTSQNQLRKLFSAFGTLNSLTIIPKSQMAFGFIEFDDIRDAVDAQKGLNKSFFRGRNLRVEYKNLKSSDTGSTSKAPIDRQIETGDQSKSKEEIVPDKQAQQQKSKVCKKKTKEKRKHRQRESRSRSRSRTKRHHHHSRSSSSSSSRSRSLSYEKRSDCHSKNSFAHIDRLYSVINRLQHRVRTLEEENKKYKQGRGYLNSHPKYHH